MTSYTLVSSDSMFDIDHGVVSMSHTLKNMLDAVGDAKNDKTNIVPIPNVSTKTLGKIVEWATLHKDEVASIIDRTKMEGIDKMHEGFAKMDLLEVDQSTLLDIILATNYLDIPSMFTVACKTLGNTLKGCTADEIRTKFAISNDLTEEEENMIRYENQWCHDFDETL